MQPEVPWNHYTVQWGQLMSSYGGPLLMPSRGCQSTNKETCTDVWYDQMVTMPCVCSASENCLGMAGPGVCAVWVHACVAWTRHHRPESFQSSQTPQDHHSLPWDAAASQDAAGLNPHGAGCLRAATVVLLRVWHRGHAALHEWVSMRALKEQGVCLYCHGCTLAFALWYWC